MISKKKFLFVSIDGLITDIAWQVIREGHEARYFIESSTDQDIGDGFIPKTDDWQKDVEWADVIVFDDVLGMGKKAQKLRKEGKLVVGGTAYTDMLEDDRSFGQEELKKAGVSILPYQNFSSFDESIEYVKNNPGRYVIKSSLDAQNIKQLLFVGEEEDGRDVIQLLEAYKKSLSKKIKLFLLQKRVVGVEIGVGAFFNGKEFVYPINVNFEHKKLFPGDIGPATGEMGCYDAKTEVLTNHGWKFFKNLTHGDTVCTLNPKSHHIEFHTPSKIVVFDHHKKLIAIKNQTLDIMVTLDHNMYVSSQWNARNKKSKFTFVKAKDLEYQSLMKRTGVWDGKEVGFFSLPTVARGHREGRVVKYRETKPIKIPMDVWLAFFGIWLADGHSSRYGQIGVAQKSPKKTKQIEDLLKKLPFIYGKSKSGFYIYNKQLWSYLKDFGGARNKYVPAFIKNLTPRQILIFLQWFSLGDGTLMKNNFRIFYTSSRILADDIQELLLKAGRTGVITKRKRSTKRVWIQDHFAVSSGAQYEILERVKKHDSWIDKRDLKEVRYGGKVYCATVRNHIMFVRRNGKPYWCGNTSMFWSAPNNVFNNTLKKMEGKLKEEGYVGYIDLNCIVNANGIYPLEFTARFGYPTISIQQEGILNPIGEFLYQLAAGEQIKFRTRSGFQVGVRLVVPPFPFYRDTKTFEINSKDAVILFKKPQRDGIHIEDVKEINGEWVIAGTSGVVLIVVGLGQTMKQAQAQVYNRIQNIMMPNMYYRKDIGNRWFEDSDKLHNWGYLREF